MSDIALLYNARDNRYRGVYPHRSSGKWYTLVYSVEGKQSTVGTFDTPEQGAKAVIEYYKQEFGAWWREMLPGKRGTSWRITRIARTFTRTVWLVRVGTVQLTPAHLGLPEEVGGWNQDGWRTREAALIAVRVFRSLHGMTPLTSPSSQSCLPELVEELMDSLPP